MNGNMEEWFLQIFNQYPYFVYGLIVITSFIEGPILALFCGLLIKLEIMPLLPAYIALMAGDLIGDIVWYSIGYYFGHPFIRRFGRYFSVSEDGVKMVTRIFHKYHNRILIISKVTMGFGFALVTLITAGIVKIPFKKYLALNFLGQLFWSAFLLALGHTFGNLYVNIDHVFGKISTVALIIITMFALIGFGKYVKGRIIKTVQTT